MFHNDEESELEAEYSAARLALGGPMSIKKFPEQRDTVKLRKSQALIHVSFTDMRIEQLESEVKRLRRVLKDLPEGFDVASGQNVSESDPISSSSI